MVLYSSNVWFPFELESIWIQSKFFPYCNPFVLLLEVLQFYTKHKAAPFSFNRGKIDCPIKLPYNLVCNHEPNSNAICVDHLLIPNKPEQLKQLFLILCFNPNTTVLHRNLKKPIALRILLNFNIDDDMTLPSELDSVALDAEQNLHYPLLVRHYKRAVKALFGVELIVRYINEIYFELHILF